MAKKSLVGALTAPKSPRPAVPERAARAFEEGGTAPAPSRLRRERAAGERLTFHVPEELARELRVTCAAARRSLSDAATEALAEWVKRHRTST